jgi:hypothetical protein
MGPHVMVLRNGESLTGEILNKQFTVTTGYGSVKVAASNIIHIIFAGGSAWATNEVLLVGQSKLRGDLAPPTLRFRIQGTSETLEIAQDKVHIAIFLSTIYGN